MLLRRGGFTLPSSSPFMRSLRPLPSPFQCRSRPSLPLPSLHIPRAGFAAWIFGKGKASEAPDASSAPPSPPSASSAAAESVPKGKGREKERAYERRPLRKEKLRLKEVGEAQSGEEAVRRRAAGAIDLGSLRPVAGSRKKHRLLGRGPGSGTGKTSKRGHKGQRARNSVPIWYQGGQTPLYRRVRKYGFKNPHTIRYTPLNLWRLQAWIDRGRLPLHLHQDQPVTITMRTLVESGVLNKKEVKHGVKLLAHGKGVFTCPVPLRLEVSAASEAAKAAVEATGGSITTVYFSPANLRRFLRDPNPLSLPLPSDPPVPSDASPARIPHFFATAPRRRRDRFDVKRWGPAPPSLSSPIPSSPAPSPSPAAAPSAPPS